MKHVVEFRDEAGELHGRRDGHGRRVRAEGDKVKISGVSKGKGFQGTIKRHNFASGPKSHGSHNVRAPGSIGAAAYPARVFKGIRGPGQMGNKRVTQKGLTVVRVDADHNLLLVRGSVPGPAQRRRGGAHRWLSAPRSSARRARQPSTLDDAAFGARFNGPLVHESVRAELNARRQGTASTKTRGKVRGGGAKPWRQKGTGRARAGSSRSPIWTGGGIVFGPQPRHYTFKVNRKERRAALRSALSLHAERGTLAVLDPRRFDTPSTKQAAELLGELGRRRLGARRPRPRTQARRARCRSATSRRVSVLPAERRRRRRPRRRRVAAGLRGRARRADRARQGREVTAADEEGTE